MKRILLIVLCLLTQPLQGAPLTAWQNLPYVTRTQIATDGLFVKGNADNNWYALEVDPATGALPVQGTFVATPSLLLEDHGYGTVGPGTTLRTAAQIGNATGAADFGSGTATAQTLRTTVANFPATQPVSGTVAVTQSTSPWIVAGGGTAGTPGTAVLTVQGVGSGTPIPVSGTVTANIGTTNGLQLDTTGAKLNVAQGGALGTNTGPMEQAVALTAAPSYTTATVNPLNMTTGGALRVDATVAGAAAATSALQTTGNSSLSTIATNTTGAATGTNVTETHGTVAAGTAATKSELIGGVYNTSLPTLTNGQQVASQLDSSGRQIIAPLTSASTLSIAGKAKAVVAALDYSTTNVGNAAYVQLVSSTAAATTKIYPFDSSGAVMILAVGGVGSEVDQIYIPPGGSGAGYELAIPAGSRISLKVASFASNPNNVTSGFFVLTGLN